MWPTVSTIHDFMPSLNYIVSFLRPGLLFIQLEICFSILIAHAKFFMLSYHFGLLSFPSPFNIPHEIAMCWFFFWLLTFVNGKAVRVLDRTPLFVSSFLISNVLSLPQPIDNTVSKRNIVGKVWPCLQERCTKPQSLQWDRGSFG